MATPRTGLPVGRPGGSVISAATVTGKGDVPDKPTGLGSHGGKLWDALWTLGSFQASDFLIVQMLCEAWQDYKSLRTQSSKLGDFYELPNGTKLAHPWRKEVRELRIQITSWITSLGLSPAGRSRLAVEASTTEASAALRKMEQVLRGLQNDDD